MKARKTTTEKGGKAIQSGDCALRSEKEYAATMKKIETLMAKGSQNVNVGELAEIRRLALLAEAYEQNKFAIADPTTFSGLLEMKMFEMKLKQKDLAKKLEISDAKLSLILGGKQKPDVSFLKAVHQKLSIDANLLLNAV